MNKIWLHRISHESGVSYPLLKRGYLSIGFSDFARDAAFVSAMRDENGGWEVFEEANDRIWGERYRGRYNLWRFLCEFAVGDIVLVPSWGSFYLYRIASGFQTAGAADTTDLKDWSGNALKSDGVLLLRNGETIDIGFVRKVEKICGPLMRDEYAEAALSSRMKMRQTNADIGDLRPAVERVMNLARSGKKLSYHGALLARLQAETLGVTKEILIPDKLEKAVKWYLEKLGADDVYIPPKPKDESEKRNGADADVVAIFENLKIVLYVQVKFHDDETSDWAVRQINEYCAQKQRERESQDDADPEYTYIPWVVSTCDSFGADAVRLAREKRVRLIDGRSFAGMLLDAGLTGIDDAFA